MRYRIGTDLRDLEAECSEKLDHADRSKGLVCPKSGAVGSVKMYITLPFRIWSSAACRPACAVLLRPTRRAGRHVLEHVEERDGVERRPGVHEIRKCGAVDLETAAASVTRDDGSRVDADVFEFARRRQPE